MYYLLYCIVLYCNEQEGRQDEFNVLRMGCWLYIASWVNFVHFCVCVVDGSFDSILLSVFAGDMFFY